VTSDCYDCELSMIGRSSSLGLRFSCSKQIKVTGVPGRQFLSFWSWSKKPEVEFSLVSPIPSKLSSEKSGYQTALSLPDHIRKPDYALSTIGRVDQRVIPAKPVIWSEFELIKIRESCQLARKVLNEIKDIVKPGVSTEELDDFARELIILHNAYPSPLNFHGYTKSISTSVNNIAAHGIPDARKLQTGDILNIDVTVFLDGHHGDCSETVVVGETDEYALKLIEVTKQCLERGISYCRPGKLLSGIGRAIHKHARRNQCAVVPTFIGHGIGEFFHGPPDIYHCLNNYPGAMTPGMVFTIEPCISEGDRRVKILADGWTAVTLDNSRTAQFEHTIAITDTGVEVLTK